MLSRNSMPFVQSYLLTNQCDELKNVFLQGLWKTHVSFIFILIELYHIFPKISRRKSIQWKPWRAVHLEMYVGHTVGTISSMYTTSENKFRELSYLFSNSLCFTLQKDLLGQTTYGSTLHLFLSHKWKKEMTKCTRTE